ncbi:MAG: hypothetical protein KJ927_15035 [Candidatus Eisenbacteria bacterium]|nr:hypothetical protein [Candidatus Eisenbacteria bacterium]MBU1950027.1 hypothetical protein [Candidatus Eisenbacteria bacterium]
MKGKYRDPSRRGIYSDLAIRQIPRLLSVTDREEFSPTYGCMDREYWLCRSTDFPSSIAQFGIQSLALVYAHPFSNNPYHRHPKILKIVLAAMDYWIKIQKNDGSFDEFYPNERGWAGPTGFLVYAMARAYREVAPLMPGDLRDRFLKSLSKAGRFLARYDEPGVLANHHAMAILPIYEAYDILGERQLLEGFHDRLNDFLGYTNEEGWCLEYDGPDLGYLSATVSFLEKLGRLYKDDRLEDVILRAVEFCSYFVYPNGFFAGTVSSRQTVHFYPHGFEMRAGSDPLAAAVAEAMLASLGEGKLVPPEIQEDRYFKYRIPEFLEAYLDYAPVEKSLEPLPYERPPFQKYWPGARMAARRGDNYYAVTSLGKGGVLKLFRSDTGRLIFNDCGLRLLLKKGGEVTTGWMDPDYKTEVNDNVLEISGHLHKVVHKVFTPLKMILFRLFMLTFGWHTGMAYNIKGWIRKLLMLRSGIAPVQFTRKIIFEKDSCLMTDTIRLEPGVEVLKGTLGDEFSPRYVPQSRYFQSQELDVEGYDLTAEDLERLNHRRSLLITRTISYSEGLMDCRSRDDTSSAN